MNKRPALHLIEHLVKLAELGDFLHNLFPHEEWCVDGGEPFLAKDTESQLDKGLLEENCTTLKEGGGGG